MCSLVSLSSSLSYGMDSKRVAWGDRKASEQRKQAWGTKGQEKKTTGAKSYVDAVTNSTNGSGPQTMMYESSRQVVAKYQKSTDATKKNPSSDQATVTLLKRNEAPIQQQRTSSVQTSDEDSDEVPLFIPTQPFDEEAPELPEQKTAEFDTKTLTRLALMADMLPKVLAHQEKAATDLKQQLQSQAQAHADQMQTMALHFQQQLSAAHREFDTQMLAEQKAHFAQIEKLTKEHAAELAGIHQILGLQNYHLYNAFVRLGLAQAVPVEQVEHMEQAEYQAE